MMVIWPGEEGYEGMGRRGMRAWGGGGYDDVWGGGEERRAWGRGGL